MAYYNDATPAEINDALLRSNEAFKQYKLISLKERAGFLYAIAKEMEAMSSLLIATANRETHLDEARLKVELTRTIFQLTSYADACAEGTWMEIRIDTGDKQRNPPKPDLRKMLIPLGPVVVFGASNFPFAYSTAGGDTACALAAGCPVILKAHPAHADTSELVAKAVQNAAKKCNLPASMFIHIHGSGFEVGTALVQHPLVKAVGFTGSFEGGKALFDLANQREVPIPVFAEMGSVNPVFLLPHKLSSNKKEIASSLAASITQSSGQFCTKPGILVAIKDDVLVEFENELQAIIDKVEPVYMLTDKIGENFHTGIKVRYAEGAKILTRNNVNVEQGQSFPTLASVSAKHFLTTVADIDSSMADDKEAATSFYFERLRKEVFGPFSLLVECDDFNELLEVASSLEGQLTTTLFATNDEAHAHQSLIETLKEKCGRLILNGVPTGVEVALSMQHGGPYPATTDSRFTAVGADGIKRFARPVCYQGWSNDLLPDELKNENPLNIWRTVNNQLTKEPVHFE